MKLMCSSHVITLPAILATIKQHTPDEYKHVHEYRAIRLYHMYLHGLVTGGEVIAIAEGRMK